MPSTDTTTLEDVTAENIANWTRMRIEQNLPEAVIEDAVKGAGWTVTEGAAQVQISAKVTGVRVRKSVVAIKSGRKTPDGGLDSGPTMTLEMGGDMVGSTIDIIAAVVLEYLGYNK